MSVEQANRSRPSPSFELLADELAVNPHLLLTVLDAIRDRVFVKNADGELIFANALFLECFGLNAEQVEGKHCREFLPAEMIDGCEQADESVFNTGKPVSLQSQWTDPVTGKTRYSETHKAPIRDTAGKVIGLVGTSRDITSRRNTEEELKQQNTLLELIVETVPDEISVKDTENRLLLGNQTFFQRHQLEEGEVLGTDPTTALPLQAQAIARDAYKCVLESRQPTIGSVRVPDAEGKERFLEFRKMPLVVEGETKGVLTVSRDLTDWKETEEQSKRNESMLLHAARLSSLGELSAGIAHEVNQPLYSILNYAKAIQNKLREPGELDVATISNWVDQIHDEAKRGGEITRHLTAFVRPSETRKTATSIDATISETIRFMHIETRDAGVLVEERFEKDLPEVLIDRVQIQQVLVNLLKNSIEACIEAQTPCPTVVVEARKIASNVEISVADNGPGVKTPDGINIFDAFQTTKHGGAGLGLAICQSIIEGHAGRLTYETNRLGGVTFRFQLPVIETTSATDEVECL